MVLEFIQNDQGFLQKLRCLLKTRSLIRFGHKTPRAPKNITRPLAPRLEP